MFLAWMHSDESRAAIAAPAPPVRKQHANNRAFIIDWEIWLDFLGGLLPVFDWVSSGKESRGLLRICNTIPGMVYCRVKMGP